MISLPWASRLAVGLMTALLFSSCSTPKAKPSSTKKSVRSTTSTTQDMSGEWKEYQTGVASWYGGRWHRRLTANGERYDQNSMTAAHKKLPFNTRVKVTNLRNGRSCIVRVNNRGPYIKGRIIDLSVAAAKEIGTYGSGLGRVRLEVKK